MVKKLKEIIFPRLQFIDSAFKLMRTEPNYHKTKLFSNNSLAVKMKKTQIHVNKPAYLGLSIQTG